MVVLALGTMVVGQQQAFRSGLLGYARKLEAARVTVLAEQLAGIYRVEGGWDFLRERPQRWAALSHQLATGEVGRVGGSVPPRFDERPPPMRGERLAERPLLRDRPRRLEDRRRPSPGGGRNPPRAFEFPRRLSLLDAEEQWLVGPMPAPDTLSQPITVEGKVIGFLALAQLPELNDEAGLDFEHEQAQLAAIIAVIVLLLTALASLALSRRLLRRVSRLADASRRLAGGDFSARLGSLGSDELGDLARDFDQLADALQEGRAARDRWVADISHELRTPLTVLRGELHALQDGIRPLNAAAVASMAFEADRLKQRIDDLYALTLSDHGGLRYRFAEVDLCALIEAACRHMSESCASAGLTLSTDIPSRPTYAHADTERLHQLLSNLLSNAIRYTDSGGRIEIQLADGEAGMWLLSVRDSAPSVPTDELEALFERHHRGADGVSRAPQGAGLGLAICRNIAAAHRGEIWAEASPLGGLEIKVRLPKSRTGGEQ